MTSLTINYPEKLQPYRLDNGLINFDSILERPRMLGKLIFYLCKQPEGQRSILKFLFSKAIQYYEEQHTEMPLKRIFKLSVASIPIFKGTYADYIKRGLKELPNEFNTYPLKSSEHESVQKKSSSSAKIAQCIRSNFNEIASVVEKDTLLDFSIVSTALEVKAISEDDISYIIHTTSSPIPCNLILLIEKCHFLQNTVFINFPKLLEERKYGFKIKPELLPALASYLGNQENTKLSNLEEAIDFLFAMKDNDIPAIYSEVEALINHNLSENIWRVDETTISGALSLPRNPPVLGKCSAWINQELYDYYVVKYDPLDDYCSLQILQYPHKDEARKILTQLLSLANEITFGDLTMARFILQKYKLPTKSEASVVQISMTAEMQINENDFTLVCTEFPNCRTIQLNGFISKSNEISLDWCKQKEVVLSGRNEFNQLYTCRLDDGKYTCLINAHLIRRSKPKKLPKDFDTKQLSFESIKQFLQYTTDQSEINLTDIPIVQHKFIHLITQRTDLLALKLEKACKPTSVLMDAISQNCKKLECLYLSDCQMLKDEDFFRRSNNTLRFPQLRKLKLENCEQLTDVIFEMINKGKYTEVYLSGCTRITDEGLKKLKNRDLTSITLLKCPQITGVGIEEIRKAIPRCNITWDI